MPSNIEYLGDKYTYFYYLMIEFKKTFSEDTNKQYSFWDVEHVFWYYYVKSSNSIFATKSDKNNEGKDILHNMKEEDYIPPITREIPLLAIADKAIVEKYEKRNHEPASSKVDYRFEEKQEAIMESYSKKVGEA